MPYIESDARIRLNEIVEEVELADIATPGELNYLFTQLALRYIDIHGMRYAVANDIIGALEGCKLEFYRRLVANYETGAKNRNGDVY